jgi:hypothetical protein
MFRYAWEEDSPPRPYAARATQTFGLLSPKRVVLRGPVNSPPEAGSIRHLRPVETATPGRRHRAVKRGKLPLTNNFIW